MDDEYDYDYMELDHTRQPPYTAIAVLILFNICGGLMIVKFIVNICG